MKKTLLNNKKDYHQTREMLYKHFTSLDASRQDKYSSLEEALEIGYSTSFNTQMNKEEKHKILYKVIYTVAYECNTNQKTLNFNQMLMYRNVLASMLLVKKENETWIFSLLDMSMRILISFYKSNSDDSFFSFFVDTNYYLMDFLLDSRVTTMSDEEREKINHFYMIGEAKLAKEIENIETSDKLSTIIEFFVSRAAYWYINGELNLIEARRRYITASCLGVNKDSYHSLKVAAMLAIKALINNNPHGEKNSELEAKLIELGGGQYE